MNEMPDGWGYVEGRQELICKHGVGHPAPFSDKSTHGCDGCCNNEEFEQAVKAVKKNPEGF